MSISKHSREKSWVENLTKCPSTLSTNTPVLTSVDLSWWLWEVWVCGYSCSSDMSIGQHYCWKTRVENMTTQCRWTLSTNTPVLTSVDLSWCHQHTSAHLCRSELMSPTQQCSPLQIWADVTEQFESVLGDEDAGRLAVVHVHRCLLGQVHVVEVDVLVQRLRPDNTWHTVKSAYKKPTYKELLVIRNCFYSPNFTKELVDYTFIRNAGTKTQIFMVLMSFLSAYFTVLWNHLILWARNLMIMDMFVDTWIHGFSHSTHNC